MMLLPKFIGINGVEVFYVEEQRKIDRMPFLCGTMCWGLLRELFFAAKPLVFAAERNPQ